MTGGLAAALTGHPGQGARWGVDGVRVGSPVTVRVPATSANLGPGFDSLGLALALHDLVTVEAVDPADGDRLAVDVSGEGAGEVPLGEEHLVVAAVRAGLAQAGAGQPGLRVTCVNAVPHGRGLGSSASAVVAGLLAARGLLLDPAALGGDTVFDLTTRAEGHPDNAAAAVAGGFVVAWTDPDGTSGYVKVPLHPSVRVVACVPRTRLATSLARAVLPATVPHADAAFTAGRAALLVEALTRSPQLLWEATHERLHQTQRAPAMPSTAALVTALREQGAAAVVSGAGPAVLVLAGSPQEAAQVATHACELTAGGDPEARWEVLTPPIDTVGGVVLDPPRE